MEYDVQPITSSNSYDCGATCLKMLLEYYDIHDTTLDELVKECKTRIIGCTAKDVLEVGRKHGLEPFHAWQLQPEDLYSSDRPAICWWKHRHFIVYCGTDEDGNVVICNPDRGRYRMSKSIFKSFFSGVALDTNSEES